MAPAADAVGSSAPDPVVLGTLEAANAQHATGYRILRRLPGGHQSGAYELLGADGRRAVLKRWVAARPLDQLTRAALSVHAARAAGWPTPAWLHWGVGPDGVPYEIQEFVEGDHRARLDDVTLDELLAVNAIQADLDPPSGLDWSSWALEVLYDGRDGIVDHVSGFPAGGARLRSAVEQLRSAAGRPELPGRDLVCGVFALENILFGPDAVAGVVDVEALGRGTRAFDLAVLYSRLSSGERLSPLGRRLRSAAEAVAGEEAFAICLAAELLGVLLFVIEHRPSVAPAAFANACDTLEASALRSR